MDLNESFEMPVKPKILEYDICLFREEPWMEERAYRSTSVLNLEAQSIQSSPQKPCGHFEDACGKPVDHGKAIVALVIAPYTFEEKRFVVQLRRGVQKHIVNIFANLGRYTTPLPNTLFLGM